MYISTTLRYVAMCGCNLSNHHTWGDMQEAFQRMITGKVQWLPPALVGKQDASQQPGSRKQRRPLQPMQATPSSFNSSGSVYHRPVSLSMIPYTSCDPEQYHACLWCDSQSERVHRRPKECVAIPLLYVVQPSALESVEYFLGDAHDTAADRTAAWIPSRREQRPW